MKSEIVLSRVSDETMRLFLVNVYYVLIVLSSTNQKMFHHLRIYRVVILDL